MSNKPNPELSYDENPERTAQDFAKAQPASAVLSKLFGQKIEKSSSPDAARAPST